MPPEARPVWSRVGVSNRSLPEKLGGGLDSLSAEVGRVGARLEGGKPNPADLKSLDAQKLGADPAAAGQTIKRVLVAFPGLYT